LETFRAQASVVGGFPVGSDGRVHTIFTHNPSSLRLSSTDPNLQNLPRGNDSAIQKMVKEMFVAPVGHTFWARDYSGIEAVLVGYFASSPRYVRAAKLGVHAFLASHIVGKPFDFSWSDADVRLAIKEVKKDKPTYDTAKQIVHGSNYMMTPRKMSYEYPETFPTTAKAATLQGLYFDIFPEIKRWHLDLTARVDGTKRRRSDGGEEIDPWTLGVCYARNPFGYTHRFYNVLDWEAIEYEGKTEWISSFGEDAKRLVSFLPQSTAAAIIKRATKRIWYDFPWVGQSLRLLIHDEIFGEADDKELETCLEVSRLVMEEPIPELPLDPAWGMGTHLAIGTEAKVGKSWASMN
jgi:DNA polymerase I-like protein with 3'-5' exonuclease and polymerase domains